MSPAQNPPSKAKSRLAEPPAKPVVKGSSRLKKSNTEAANSKDSHSRADTSKSISFSSSSSTDSEKSPRHHTNSSYQSARTATTLQSLPVFVQKRIRFLPLLALGLASFAACLYIFTTIRPEEIANVLFFQSYLPLLLVVFAAVFFTSNFFFLHSRRAAEISFLCTLLLFLQLQDVIVTLPIVGAVAAVLLATEVLSTFIFKK